MWFFAVGTALLPGCPPAAVEIGMNVFSGLSAGIRRSGAFDTLVDSMLSAG